MQDTSKGLRVLVISNNALSSFGSNGRTLVGLLSGLPSVNVAQFFISGTDPDVAVASRYFRITDREAAAFALRGREPGGRRFPTPVRPYPGDGSIPRHRRKRTPFRALTREALWAMALARRPRNLTSFIEDFSPSLVMLQAGDAAFLLDLATTVAKERDIPIVVFNSEDYYFKRHNYLHGSRLQYPIYLIWHSYLRRALRRVLQGAYHTIYSCDALRRTFAQEFPTRSSTVLNSSSVEPRTLPHRDSATRFVYAGNLGLGRIDSLIQLAGVLAAVEPNATLVVYGPPLADPDLRRARATPSLDYRGFVPYAQVVDEFRACDIVVHVESFEPHIRRDTRHAFSTKIADCLASGTPLLLYAPEEIASTLYLKDGGCAIVATRYVELQEAVQSALRKDTRVAVSAAGVKIARDRHSPQTNAARVAQILQDAIRGDKETSGCA